MKKLLIALAGFAIAASALAELTKNKDWDKSPEAYFLTPAERAEWKKVSAAEDAEKFIALYYARRGGEPFKQEISRRIAAADQQFKMQRYKRGADSVRGHLLIVLGTPSRVSQSRAQDEVGNEGDITRLETKPFSEQSAIFYSWTYLADKFNPAWGIGELKAQISVDPGQGKDTLQNPGTIEKAMAVVAEKSIINPNATIVPAAPVAAPAMPLPAAVKSALESAAGKSGGDASFWSGTFWSVSGDTFLALQFYLPSNKPTFSSGSPLKFGGVVTDETGKEVESFWEQAVFAEVAEGSRKDRVLDRSVALPPGSYKGVFGLFASESEPPVASATAGFKLDPKSSDFGVSPLILSSGLVPLTKRPGPMDPFVFGTDKPIRVEPKGDHLFSKQDSLWYFYALENPGVPAAPADTTAAAPAAAVTPAAGAQPAPAPAAEAPKPRVMTRINVQRDGQDAFAPFTGPPELVATSPGFFSTGSEIPLASFEPGYYTFLITVRDLNAPRGSAANKGIERKEDFVVLMPDGSLPPKAKPAAPAKSKKP